MPLCILSWITNAPTSPFLPNSGPTLPTSLSNEATSGVLLVDRHDVAPDGVVTLSSEDIGVWHMAQSCLKKSCGGRARGALDFIEYLEAQRIGPGRHLER